MPALLPSAAAWRPRGRRAAIPLLLPLRQPGGDLRQALLESVERVRERTIWLLSLIYPSKDIRGIWGALNSGDSAKQGYAVELLDNLLTGDVKRYVFPFYGDTLEPERFRSSLRFLGLASLDAATALRMLLEQEDMWLTAATVWEIGVRRLTGFRDKIAKLLDSEKGKRKKKKKIEFIFSDKTGTLTANEMVLVQTSIGGTCYWVTKPTIKEDEEEGPPIETVETLLSHIKDSPNSETIKDFFVLLSVCHSVLPETDGDDESSKKKNYFFFFQK